ncbi:MAG: Wzz/FepE/Etk N-terminal domain-containing protein [Burkholderiales bacterium]
MTNPEHIEQDDIGLQDLWRILIAQKKWVIGLPIVFILLSIVWISTSKAKWEATAVIQIGQIAQAGAAPSPYPILIEPSVRTIERMKMKTFEDDLLVALGIPVGPGSSIANLFRNGLTVRSLGTTDLIQVRVRAYSPDQAAVWATAVVDKIIVIHKKLTQPIIDRLGKQLVELRTQMRIIEEERESIAKIVSTVATRSADGNFSQNLLLSNLLSKKNSDLLEVEMRRIVLEEQMTSIKTSPTTLIDRIYVPEKPVSPDKIIVPLLAGLMGFILGTILAFAQNYWQSNRGGI